jgi:hypothetical protein
LWLQYYRNGILVSEITTTDFRRSIAKRQQEGASKGEIDRDLTAIKRAFNLGCQAGRILARPYIPMLKENNVRNGFFDREQFESIRDHLPEDIQPVATLAYITG